MTVESAWVSFGAVRQLGPESFGKSPFCVTCFACAVLVEGRAENRDLVLRERRSVGHGILLCSNGLVEPKCTIKRREGQGPSVRWAKLPFTLSGPIPVVTLLHGLGTPQPLPSGERGFLRAKPLRCFPSALACRGGTVIRCWGVVRAGAT